MRSKVGNPDPLCFGNYRLEKYNVRAQNIFIQITILPDRVELQIHSLYKFAATTENVVNAENPSNFSLQCSNTTDVDKKFLRTVYM